MTRILPTVMFLTLFGQTACAEKKYSGYLDKYIEVANDGRLFGPEETKIQLAISIKEDRVYNEMDNFHSELTLIDKLGTAQFVTKEGIAAIQKLRVWGQLSSDKYEVQYSKNRAQRITIRARSRFTILTPLSTASRDTGDTK